MTTATTARPKASKKFKALVATLGTEEAAVVAWNSAFPDNRIADTKKVQTALPEGVQTLITAGFSEAEARELVASKGVTTTTEATAPLTSQERAEALVAKEGLTHVRGRVYTNSLLIEAQVRVLKTGKPEVVRTPGSHRTKAVVLWQTDEGSVAVQNLGSPA